MSDIKINNQDSKGRQAIISTLACEITSNLIAEIEKQPDNHARHLQLLEDSRHIIMREAAKNTNFGKWANSPDHIQEFLWNMAVRMPQYNLALLYKKRSSLLGIAAAIAAGWFLGGLASTLLNILNLGGEILRPVAIFLFIWLEEYISINPKARKITLTILGLGGLARFAAMAVGGLFRFTSFGALRQAVFGAARPNIFKGFWLMAGALFILAFFSRKITGIDIQAFRQNLLEQTEQRLAFAFFILKHMEKQNEELARLRMDLEASHHKDKSSSIHNLGRAVASVLPAMNAETRHFLRDALAANGFKLQGEDQDTFIWNNDLHSQLYTTIGLISDGDRARVLQEPYIADGKSIKGHAQKIQS